MRINLKALILCLCIVLLFATVSIWTRCGEIAPLRHSLKEETISSNVQGDEGDRGGGDGLEEIDCQINGEYIVSCRREADEVYIPFSFIHKYFEVYGKLTSFDGYEKFEWLHSYSKVYYPKAKYDPRGVFLYFENYNVEIRERVKCISAAEGVPVSTQWAPFGYFYPTQVAQFGLSHYSKNLTEPEPRCRVLEDGQAIAGSWQGSAFQRQDGRLQFNTSGGPVYLKTDHVLDFILSVDLMLRPSENSSMTVVIQNREKRETWLLHYVCSSMHIHSVGHDIYHGMNCEDGLVTNLTRDLIIDLQKGLAFQERPKRKISRSKFKVGSIVLEGNGWLDNLALSSTRHLAQFYAAAKWFVKHQVESGGWPIAVRRRGAQGLNDLMPGWVSGMGQGHGISVLSRAWYLSGDKTYLETALKALRPFTLPSTTEGGVTAKFMDIYPWFEEYPTRPPSFVLNGFIYALIGLYDLVTLGPSSQTKEAADLFQQGMNSLKKLLLLFDTGSGSHYDLRHLSLGCSPNIARWDYHATHVNQLLTLATIDPDPILTTTAQRWVRYMSGKRAQHN